MFGLRGKVTGLRLDKTFNIKPATRSKSGRRDSNPRISAWKADALPLGDSRVRSKFYHNHGHGYYAEPRVTNRLKRANQSPWTGRQYVKLRVVNGTGRDL